MSICQAIMLAFHLPMFHYHSIISFSSFNIIMSVVHLILIVKGLNPGVISYRQVSTWSLNKLFYHYLIRTRAKHISSNPFRIRIFLFFSTSCRNYPGPYIAGGRRGQLPPPGKLNVFFLTQCLILLGCFLQLYWSEISRKLSLPPQTKNPRYGPVISETINTLIHSRNSLENHTRFQTKMGKVYSRFQTKTAQKPYPAFGRHHSWQPKLEI